MLIAVVVGMVAGRASNPESARLAGVPVTRVLVSVYAIAGLLAAVGGVLSCRG